MPAPKIIPVIMSGGSGTRLWPASRMDSPKQCLPLVGARTMIQDTALRLRGEKNGFSFGDPVIICNERHAADIKTQLKDIGVTNPHIILEPVGRNTAPCAAIAALAVQSIDESALMLLAPADHLIEDEAAFAKAIQRTLPASMDGHLVTFGITASAPETGYGYIKKGATLDAHASRVAAFVEKPDLETAQEYLASGDYFWNAGIFMAAPSALLGELDAYATETLRTARLSWDNAKAQDGFTALDKDLFAACPADSIDYAVMEKTSKAAVVEANIGWSDIGSWSALWDITKGEDGNARKGDTLLIDTKDCLIHSDGTFVATIGVENLAIVVKDGAVLISAMDRVQDVKEIVGALKKRGDTGRL